MRVQLRRRIARWVGDDGAAAVEMALLIPVLVLLAYGVIEFGIIFAQDLGMGNGAREGARFAASDPNLVCHDNDPTTTDVVDLVRDASATTMLDPNDITVRVVVGADETGAPVCGVDPGGIDPQITDSGDTAGDGLCNGATSPNNRVFIITRWQRGLSIPFGPVRDSFEVNGTGVFQCEYS